RARERGGIAVPQRDAGAARVQTLRDGEADAGRAAGDDGRAAVEVEAIHRMRENVDERAPDLSIGQATSIPRKRESSTNASHCRETAHRISVIPAKAGIQYERVILCESRAFQPSRLDSRFRGNGGGKSGGRFVVVHATPPYTSKRIPCASGSAPL